jgi:hypothetical protein
MSKNEIYSEYSYDEEFNEFRITVYTNDYWLFDRIKENVDMAIDDKLEYINRQKEKETNDSSVH